MELKICHLYPDVLNLYGDRGNVISMEKRLQWRGIGCEISKLTATECKSLSAYDIVFLGSGQDSDMAQLSQKLKGGMAAEIKAAVEDGICFLAINGGFRLLGSYGQGLDGQKREYASALELYTVENGKRITGNCKFRCCDAAGGFEIVGFENHSGCTYLAQGLSPLGTVMSGFGNNGEDKGEGVLYKNVFGTFSHGPLLPKNPAFCDHILLKALQRKYGSAELAPLDDSLELAAHNEMSAKL